MATTSGNCDCRFRLCQPQVDLHRLIDRIQIFLLQSADEFDQPTPVEGADLVRFDLGVLGQIGLALGEKEWWVRK